ncbi:Protein kinase [Orpheovirus IHUMI-LCC2]|uniref:Protein kinase n=1 Tax=Orpheovirus IHUMI-LCC2 TaxID=2023057 RepID=A0A2I2L372_9VIRU|nr:Protein kinase [Orpheovirus IHUMI-LCC2]SNW61988.1 Protein kinase [Orpheovirus IHUMI-LCC2]
MKRNIMEGGYGYVFHPPLSVKDKQLNDKFLNNGYVMKVSVTENELKFSRKIRRLDPDSKHFLTFIDNGELDKNQYIKRSGKHNSDIGYYMKYGGTTIEKYVNDSKCSAKDLWNMLKYCIQGLKILENKSIVHNDIHTNNIVVGCDGLPRFIDFGLCYSYKSRIRCYNNYFFAFYNATLQRPLAEYVFNGQWSKYRDDYDHAINYYYPNTNTMEYVKVMFEERDKDKLIFYEKYLYGNLEKIDVYCLAHVFFGLVEISKDTSKTGVKFKEDNDEIYLQHLKILLNNMYHVNINLQYNLDECLKYIKCYENIITNKTNKENTI